MPMIPTTKPSIGPSISVDAIVAVRPTNVQYWVEELRKVSERRKKLKRRIGASKAAEYVPPSQLGQG
jgi:hypothetical protein